jgi:hypothetical protein
MAKSLFESLVEGIAVGLAKTFPGFFKKRVFGKMDACVDSIVLAITEALWSQTESKSEREREIVAETVNLLTGRSSPERPERVKLAALDLAQNTLSENEDIRNAAVMCLRALAAARGTEVFISNMKTIDWIAGFGPIPSEGVTWDNMHQLSWYMVKKYCPQAISNVAPLGRQGRGARQARIRNRRTYDGSGSLHPRS